MDGNRHSHVLELRVQLPGALQRFQSRLHGTPRMALWVRVSKDGHQAIASCFVDIAPVGVDT
ncbi:hypothetical protein, partial [Salmonella sp. SAL4450]|uniref:hypothetical protein n=1 Tax=Salmonella sp. SAL4450 TaxID=3159905 RepID=UPI00397B9383